MFIILFFLLTGYLFCIFIKPPSEIEKQKLMGKMVIYQSAPIKEAKKDV